jgi:hypothetical protein
VSADRDYELVWQHAPRIDDDVLDRLGDVFVANGQLQNCFKTFERFALWWEERHINSRQRELSLSRE